MIDLTTPQRQPPLAVMFLGLRILRNLGFAQLAILFLLVVRAPLDGALAPLPILAILLLGVLSILAWWRYTFMLVDDELVVTKGVFRVDRLTVPVDRIQSVAIDQQLLHRLTGLVEISVDTAGSAEAEFKIDAISRPVAEELQRQAVTIRQVLEDVPEGAEGPVSTPVVAEDRVVFTHSPMRLMRAALTTWPLAGLVVLGPLFAFGDDLGQTVPDTLPEIDRSAPQWWWIPAAIAGVLALSVLLNVVRVFLQDWDLTLRASPASLRRTSGLLSKTSRASSVARIQIVSSSQNPLQRLAGLRAVNLSTIGQGDLSLLGCDDDQWETVLDLAQPESSSDGDTERRISPDSAWLVTRNVAVVAAVVAVGGSFVVGWWSALALLIVPPTWWSARVHVRNFRWTLGSKLTTSSKVVNQSLQLTLPRKTNNVAVTQSIFERRRGLGTVLVSTAAGSISIGMLPIHEANAVRDEVLRRAETDHRPWM